MNPPPKKKLAGVLGAGERSHKEQQQGYEYQSAEADQYDFAEQVTAE
jgi:hypothetical protein